MLIFKILLIILIANASNEVSCDSDSVCGELNTCENHKCIHKSLFPLAPIEYIGTFVMLFVACIANAGGIGGSSIIISLMLLLFEFDAHSSIAYTQVFIFSGTFAAITLKIKDRHPTRDRPLIYYDILMPIIGPITLGVSIGVMMNPMFPEWLILGLLTFLVTFLFWDVLGRAKKMIIKEKGQRNASINDCPLDDENEVKESLKEKLNSFLYESLSQHSVYRGSELSFIKGPQHLSIHSDNLVENHIKASSIINIANNQKKNEPDSAACNREMKEPTNDHQQVLLNNEYVQKVQAIYLQERKIISWMPLTYFVLLTIISITFSIMSKNTSISGIKSCTLEYFSLFIGYILLLFLLILLISYYLLQKTKICEKGGYNFDEGDIHWDYHKCAVMCFYGTITGIIAGLLGLGGGNIIGPLLLRLGVRPEVSTISSSFSIFISSGIAAALFFISGDIKLDYAIWYFGDSIIGSVIGILILRKFAIKRKRLSILVICIAFILFSSLIVIPVVGIINAVKQSNDGVFEVGFSPFCK